MLFRSMPKRSGVLGDVSRGVAGAGELLLAPSMFSKWLRREETGFCAACQELRTPLYEGIWAQKLTMDEPSVLSAAGRSMLKPLASASTGIGCVDAHRPPRARTIRGWGRDSAKCVPRARTMDGWGSERKVRVFGGRMAKTMGGRATGGDSARLGYCVCSYSAAA